MTQLKPHLKAIIRAAGSLTFAEEKYFLNDRMGLLAFVNFQKST
jgi:hypothetical protein